MNVMSFTGNLGRDVDVREVSGTSVANFAVAMKSGFGDKAQTIWVDCALWGKRAEGGLTQYLMKGQQVAVTGELGTREYQRNDGSNGFAVTCRVGDVTLIGGKPGSQPAAPQQPAQPQQQPAPAPQPPASSGGSMDDDIPF